MFRKQYSITVFVIMFALFAMFFCQYSWAEEVNKSTNQPASDEQMAIVTSIRPLKWLIQDIVGKLAKVEVLLEDNQNHHLLALKPSQLRKIAHADMFFYIHADFETFVQKIVQPPQSDFIALGTIPNLRLLSNRQSGEIPHVVVEKQTVQPLVTNYANSGHTHSSGVDWHIWLSPENALVMQEFIATKLIEHDAKNADIYRQNLSKSQDEIMGMARRTAEKLKPVLQRDFIVLHDGYQYFEEQYGLQAKATVFKHESLISLKRMSYIKQTMREENIRVLMKEEQFSDRAIKHLAENMVVVQLDSLGQGKAKNMTSYVEFKEKFVNDFYEGLAQAR